MQNERCLVVISTILEKLPPAILRCTSKIEHLIFEDLGDVLRISCRRYTDGVILEEDIQYVSSNARDLIEAILLMSQRKAAGNGFILYVHASWIFDVCRTTILLSDIPYGIWMRNDLNFNWTNHHALACARIRLCFDQEISLQFRSKYVFDCEYFSSEGILPDFDVLASRKYQKESLLNNSIVEGKGANKTLLVSYYMPPAETVAVHRLQYWEEMLPKVARERGDNMKVATLTATHSYKKNGQYLFVKDEGGINCEDSETIHLVDKLKSARVNYHAAYWMDNIRRYFEQNSHYSFDAVVMSGNPFFYFGLGEYFKKKWDAKIILDFRDPFANNPRFEYTAEHKSLFTDLEARYIENADYAISVNQYCVDALIIDDAKKAKVVANGFDERVVSNIRPIPVKDDDELINFICTGSFYADRDPLPFLSALDPERFKLVHIGRVRDAEAHFDEYSAMTRYGLMPYEDVIGYCKSMDIGVIFTSGAPFEQTTKIFDYIATGLSILIVTDGEPHTGELENITKDLENIFWVRNNVSEIRKFLKGFTLPGKSSLNREGFSRKAQTERLYDLIMEN